MQEGREGDVQALEDAHGGPPTGSRGADPGKDALSRLVRDVQTGGVSYQTMADRATKLGHEISKPYFQKLAAGRVVTAPDPDRLQAIAAGLRVRLPVVKRAAALQYLDYRATELSGYDEEVRVIVAHLAGKTRPELRRWRAMIEAEERLRADEE